MPYIKPELRLKVDYILNRIYVEKEVTEDLLSNQLLLMGVLNSMDKDVFDGVLNYCCTQLIRHTDDKGVLESTLQNILYKQFLDFPRYQKLKDCYGLLFAMKDEFQRRGWNDYGMIKKMYQRLSTVAKKFEKAACEKNGDLE